MNLLATSYGFVVFFQETFWGFPLLSLFLYYIQLKYLRVYR